MSGMAAEWSACACICSKTLCSCVNRCAPVIPAMAMVSQKAQAHWSAQKRFMMLPHETASWCITQHIIACCLALSQGCKSSWYVTIGQHTC